MINYYKKILENKITNTQKQNNNKDTALSLNIM